jgi:hypothetical protein
LEVVAHQIEEVLADVCGHWCVALSRRLHEASRVLVDAWKGHACEVDPLSGALLDDLGDAVVDLAPQPSEVTKRSRVGCFRSSLHSAGELINATRGEGCFAGRMSAVADHPTDVVGRADEAEVGRRTPGPDRRRRRIEGGGVTRDDALGVEDEPQAFRVGKFAETDEQVVLGLEYAGQSGQARSLDESAAGLPSAEVDRVVGLVIPGECRAGLGRTAEPAAVL